MQLINAAIMKKTDLYVIMNTISCVTATVNTTDFYIYENEGFNNWGSVYFYFSPVYAFFYYYQ